MEPAFVTPATTSRPAEPWLASHAPPRMETEPLTPAELHAWFRGGEPEADTCERLLASAARARGAVELAIAEGLDVLRQGDEAQPIGQQKHS